MAHFAREDLIAFHANRKSSFYSFSLYVKCVWARVGSHASVCIAGQ